IIDFLTLSLSVIIFLLFFVRIRLPPRSTLFPYTTLFRSVMKHTARKVRRLYRNQVIAGFAGSVADAITLFEKFEGKLEEHGGHLDRKSTRLNSSHVKISYAVFCLKKKKQQLNERTQETRQ